ncbi:Peroxisome biogenesis protein 5 [Acorus calamus]|uniref:Peroxisome biogenesis protein 5 n=1 Tax=Acorus calamus TaxID=4465 RepID=A0AAV9E6Q2_ACOCL|nr:Peroxisome biogenesis protein 5 [Acorus calamus]
MQGILGGSMTALLVGKSEVHGPDGRDPPGNPASLLVQSPQFGPSHGVLHQAEGEKLLVHPFFPSVTLSHFLREEPDPRDGRDPTQSKLPFTVILVNLHSTNQHPHCRCPSTEHPPLMDLKDLNLKRNFASPNFPVFDRRRLNHRLVSACSLRRPSPEKAAILGGPPYLGPPPSNGATQVELDSSPQLKAVEGEQVKVGWPAWLAEHAGEAIWGWVPRWADLFERLDKVKTLLHSLDIADNWEDSYDSFLNEKVVISKQRSGSSRSAYIFCDMNPYVGHPNPLKEGQ